MADRLDAMQVFVAVADARSFAAVARDKGLSASVVTRLVADLETRLGVRLLQRTTRTVRLTDAGARYLERCRRILAELEEADLFAQEERAQPRGRLVVSAPVLFGRMHVASLVSRYLRLHPQMKVDLRLSDRLASLVEDGIDVAIRIGDLADSELIVRTFGRTRRVLVASPGYLSGPLGAPRHPRDLVRHALIAFDAITPGLAWRFHDQGATTDVAVEPNLTTNSGDAALNYALADGGITAALCYQVDAALRRGDLVEVLEAYAPPSVPIQAVHPTSRLLSSKVRAFLDLAESSTSDWRSLAQRAIVDVSVKQGV